MTDPTPAYAHHGGIDVAARTLQPALGAGAAPAADLAAVANTPAGWEALQDALRAGGATPATTLLVLEATGPYWQGAATALTAAGWHVSVVSPASARHYARARLHRAKTDTVDARGLAAYGRDLRPARWAPADADVQALQLLVRARDDLVAQRTQARNRQHALAQLPAVPDEVRAAGAAVLAALAAQIAALGAAIERRATTAAALADDIARLRTIAGVGLLTAAIVVAETRPWRHGATPRQVVAHAGLDPAPHESGTSVRGAGHISKTGNARLRQAVYMAAISAARCNPPLKAFYERLRANGKKPKVALVAVARKLLVLMMTLLTHQRTFDPAWAARRPAR